MVAMSRNNSNINADKVGWRVHEWADDVGLGRAFTYQLIGEGRIKSVKIGAARIITTPPADYLKNLAEGGDDL
jgi:hypothetical protein